MSWGQKHVLDKLPLHLSFSPITILPAEAAGGGSRRHGQTDSGSGRGGSAEIELETMVVPAIVVEIGSLHRTATTIQTYVPA